MYAILCPLKSKYDVAQEMISAKNCIVALGGHGKVNYAVKATELLIANPSIKTLICLGVGGGLSNTVSALDVVIATKTIEHDYIEKFSPKGGLPQVKSDPYVLDQIKKHQFDKFKTHFGPIASGDEDIISQDRIDSVVSKTAALAVGWEGMGGAKACRLLGKSFIEIRGVTDSCQSSASVDFSKNLKQAMIHACEVVSLFVGKD